MGLSSHFFTSPQIKRYFLFPLSLSFSFSPAALFLFLPPPPPFLSFFCLVSPICRRGVRRLLRCVSSIDRMASLPWERYSESEKGKGVMKNQAPSENPSIGPKLLASTMRAHRDPIRNDAVSLSSRQGVLISDVQGDLGKTGTVFARAMMEIKLLRVR